MGNFKQSGVLSEIRRHQTGKYSSPSVIRTAWCEGWLGLPGIRKPEGKLL